MTEHGLGLARIGYDAYKKAMRGKTFRGEDMLDWDDLPEHIKAGWRAAAHAASGATVKAIVESDAITRAISDGVDEIGSHSDHSRTPDLTDNPAPQIKRAQQF